MKSINPYMKFDVQTQQPNRYYCVVLYFQQQFQVVLAFGEKFFCFHENDCYFVERSEGTPVQCSQSVLESLYFFLSHWLSTGRSEHVTETLVDKDKSGQFCGLCLLNTFSTAFQQPQTQSFLSINYLCTYQEVVQ